MNISVPYFKQEKNTTCGAACLRMVFALNGVIQSEIEIEEICDTSWLGNTCDELAVGTIKLGLQSEVIENIDINALKDFIENGFPIIALIDPAVIYGGIQGFGHFVIITGYEDNQIFYHDPDLSSDLTIDASEFYNAWAEHSCRGIRVWKSMKK